MPDTATDPLSIAREVVASDPAKHEIFMTVELRQRTGLGLREAKALVEQALDEVKGIYYVVTSGHSVLADPLVGLEAANRAAASLPHSTVILVLSTYDTPHDAAIRFARAFHYRSLIDQLLRLTAKNSPDLSPVLSDEAARARLIDWAVAQVASER